MAYLRIPTLSRLREIKAVVFDFDGVFTDNRVIVSETGEESVVCDRGDGMGTAILKTCGIEMLILSKETNKVVEARGRKLGIEVIQGCDEKLPALKLWLDSKKIRPENTAYLGNDINDIECLSFVEFAVIPADAHPDVHSHANWTLSRSGGRGAIREFADGIVKARQQ